jgi:hypothetical protein
MVSLTIAVLAGCATAGSGRVSPRELSITPLSTYQTRQKYRLMETYNPFTTIATQLTTLPTNLLAVELSVPGGSVQSVEVEELSLYTQKGDFIVEAKTKKEIVNYWHALSVTQDQLDIIDPFIDRFYLPPSPLTKKKLDHEWVFVFVTKEKVKPTDRVTATIKVDGETRTFDIYVGAASPIKPKVNKDGKAISPKPKIEPKAPDGDEGEDASSAPVEGEVPIK